MLKAPNLSQYDKIKEYKGKKYADVKVGHGHTWQYEAGEWKETKVTPNKWKFSYKVGKKRKGKVPEGSGAPVGTEYHWYIIADQVVKKLDANSYSTEMTGTKYKHADKENWNINDAKQKEGNHKNPQRNDRGAGNPGGTGNDNGNGEKAEKVQANAVSVCRSLTGRLISLVVL